MARSCAPARAWELTSYQMSWIILGEQLSCITSGEFTSGTATNESNVILNYPPIENHILIAIVTEIKIAIFYM